MEDTEGHVCLDFHAAFGAILLGHGDPRIMGAVIRALEQVDLTGAGVTEIELALAERICRHVPCAEKVLLCMTGSEATTYAARLARAATGRRKVIRFAGSYHGWHDAVLLDTVEVPYNSLDRVEKAMNDGAGIIVEPVQHNAGGTLPSAGFLEGLREIATRREAVLIFDEVITGIRHHVGGYQAVCGVTPDLATFAKSMGNGFPVAAVCGRADLMDLLGERTVYAGTYNGHTAGVAASLAVFDALEDGAIHRRLAALGEQTAESLRGIFERRKVNARVTQLGSIFAAWFANSEQDRVWRRKLRERGIFLHSTPGKRGHVMDAHTEEHLAKLLQAAEDSLA